jgi:prepilin-type N-terminal cleavage/methylation domain-containing protein
MAGEADAFRGGAVSGDAADRSRAGFTLVEVVVAMLLLAVGFLGLTAVGAGSLRLVATAEMRTGRTMEAATHMERSLLRIRQAGALADSSWTLPNGDRIDRTVTRSSDGKLWSVSLRLTPAAAHQSGQTIRLNSHVFLP